ncbi:hypothetical protein [Methanogenium cariaci]|uniref:hypothetical protein n=1 Tax=Methanogenium cariaci TaxID=2197 RepID=UPI001FDECE50|nr:hypothetical protein [Methanogenium cariaci]
MIFSNNTAPPGSYSRPPSLRASSASVGTSCPENACARMDCRSFAMRSRAVATFASIWLAQAKRASTRRTISCCSGGSGGGVEK